MTAARACIAIVAVVVIAWLGVMERNTRLQASGTEATARLQFGRAEADFKAARLLNPDTMPDMRRAFVYQASSRPREAAALLEDVLRREPDNRVAWGVLEQFTRERDRATSRRARAELRRLDPLNAR